MCVNYFPPILYSVAAVTYVEPICVLHWLCKETLGNQLHHAPTGETRRTYITGLVKVPLADSTEIRANTCAAPV